MKKVFFLALLLTLILPGMTAAQNDGCDPVDLQNWLVERQAWRNASQDVLDAQGMTIQTARTYLYDHLQAIEDLSRPACADSAMLWTYYLYSNLQHLLTCAQNNDSACVAAVQTRLVNYRTRDVQIMDELGSAVGFTVEANADTRPEGWTLNIAPTPLPPTNTPQPAHPTQASPPTQAPASGWTCGGNVYDCRDFPSCADAMSYFLACPGDPSKLDGDSDGVPCESLCQ